MVISVQGEEGYSACQSEPKHDENIMIISVTIDSCAWNFFSDNKYDLCVELPPERFSLFITREVELELDQIPDESHGVDKRLLKDYIRTSIQLRNVETSSIFGFSEANVPGEPSRYGGFGQGTFESDIERDWRQREDTKRYVIDAPKRKSSFLRKDEADVSQAVASLSSVLITADAKKGPISVAAVNGGRVLYLSEFQNSGLKLADYIEQLFAEPGGTA